RPWRYRRGRSAGPGQPGCLFRSRAFGRSQRLFDLVDEARDHLEAAPPEGRVARVEPERRQKFLVALGTAGLKHFQILLLEALMAVAEDVVERVHQAVAEGIGIDVERRVDEVRDI